jgi:hypothetical protein
VTNLKAAYRDFRHKVQQTEEGRTSIGEVDDNFAISPN